MTDMSISLACKKLTKVTRLIPVDCGRFDGWRQSTWNPRSHSEHRNKSVYTSSAISQDLVSYLRPYSAVS